MQGLVIDDPKLNFSSSHFIAEHDKCERLHGHNYNVKVVLRGELNENSMVIDFREAKEKVLAICDMLDHKLLLPSNSPSLRITKRDDQIEVLSGDKFYSFPQVDCELLPIRATTAEELASYIFDEIHKSLPELSKVYVSESEGSVAFYERA
jgi:6-pyruvoyltetrahydropterin/6-carboxytetrahydropterin synthase